ncbi:ABC transporter permease [Rhizobium vallis]|uniref:ABC transporter permease n=1 Tax=Rhizobium vallis TaxID=634290 RepID=A0A432PMV3_9HYPH|nr:ABC transporter permease [Rhizobium vallis]RUM25820.1 ABC transporter permease [Rhizobium vallis]
MAADLDIAEAQISHKRWLTTPALLCILLFGMVPLITVLCYSLMQPSEYGGVIGRFSSDAYISLLFQRDIFDDTLTFSPDYLIIFVRTLAFGVATTTLCLLIGFPTAYFMATRPPHTRNRWVLLITIPFWSNLLVRTIAIMFIIRDEGLINTALISVGLVDRPVGMIFTDFAVIVGLIYSFLPFMILPIYAALEKIDFRMAEAGFDLYASRFQVLWRIIIPLAMPGIITGCVLVFIPTFGAYVTPLLLGGGRHMMIGDLIALQFGSSRNWPLGSAFATVLMGFVLLALYIQARKAMGVSHG